RTRSRHRHRTSLHFSANMNRLALLILFAASSAFAQTVDPQLSAYMDTVGAIDNHAHVYAPDLPDDQGYDALRCDGLPPDQGPPAANFRFGADTKTTWKALYGVEPKSANDAELKRPQMIDALRKAHGDNYYDWVLQKSGMDVVLANRVAMTPGLKPPHFRWVPYADALLFPLNNDGLKTANPDRRELFRMEEEVRQAYFKQAGITQLPPTLDDYLDKVVRPILQQQKQAGAVAIKFEAAYLRKLNFAVASHDAADAVYRRSVNGPTPADYKVLQDFLFHQVAVEAGKLGLAVHIHTGAGCGQFFDDPGSDPMQLIEVFNDVTLRSTNFVMLHGGTPFNRNVTTLIIKPNVFVDISVLEFMFSPAELAQIIRPWLEVMPERVLFGTDAGTFSPGMEWVETTWLGAHKARQALGIVLTQMMKDGVIDQTRAKEIAQRVLRSNAAALYHLGK
ncbi:MAG: amidohydrolase family protein, partial [Limisphaerales bacterium]